MFSTYRFMSVSFVHCVRDDSELLNRIEDPVKRRPSVLTSVLSRGRVRTPSVQEPFCAYPFGACPFGNTPGQRVPDANIVCSDAKITSAWGPRQSRNN